MRLLTVNAGSTSMKVATVRGQEATPHGSLEEALAELCVSNEERSGV